ncbi:MAG: hypothetical protein SGPRY_000497 [Prymnesium sp.]
MRRPADTPVQSFQKDFPPTRVDGLARAGRGRRGEAREERGAGGIEELPLLTKGVASIIHKAGANAGIPFVSDRGQGAGSARTKAVAFRLEPELEAARSSQDKVKRELRFCGGDELEAKDKGEVIVRELVAPTFNKVEFGKEAKYTLGPAAPAADTPEGLREIWKVVKAALIAVAESRLTTQEWLAWRPGSERLQSLLGWR